MVSRSTDAESAEPNSSPSMPPNESEGYWTKPITITRGRLLGMVLVALLVGSAGLALAFAGYKQLRDDQVQSLARENERDRVEAIRRQYEGDLRLYDKKQSDYFICNTNAQNRVDGRANFRDYETAKAHDFHDLLIQTAPGSQTVEVLADQDLTNRLALLDDKEPPLDLAIEQAICPMPGPEPVKPPEITDS